MPKTKPGDGSEGDVRNAGRNGDDFSPRQLRRFPLVDECVHANDDTVCRRTECSYHLEHRGYGEHRLHPTRDCALVVASEGEHTLEEVAAVLGVSTEYVRQIEARALQKLHRSALLRLFDDEAATAGADRNAIRE